MDDELERAMPEGVAGDTMLGRAQRLAPAQAAWIASPWSRVSV